MHAVIGRSRYKMEELSIQLKGAAAHSLLESGSHPMLPYVMSDGSVPGMWSEGQWIEYLDSEEAIENAIRYVEENPIHEGKKAQHWSFVQPFQGIPRVHGLPTTNHPKTNAGLFCLTRRRSQGRANGLTTHKFCHRVFCRTIFVRLDKR